MAQSNLTAARKFRPGHYCAMPRLDKLLIAMKAALVPGLTGFHVRLPWRDAEPTKGNFDFTFIAEVLKFCEAEGKTAIIMLVDKSFTNENPLPLYLHKYAIPNRSGGFTCARWRAEPVARLKALIKAIGLRFDSHPAFEGVALQESSLSINEKTLMLHAYTPEKYRDALISVMTSASTSLPTSRIFWYMNYLPGKQVYIDQIINAIAPLGHAMGGPDWLPEGSTLQRAVYPFYSAHEGELPMFISAQYDSYRHLHRRAAPTKYWTPQELLDSAADQLKVDYFFWTMAMRPIPSDSYCYKDAIPVIGSSPVSEVQDPMSESLPEDYECGYDCSNNGENDDE